MFQFAQCLPIRVLSINIELTKSEAGWERRSSEKSSCTHGETPMIWEISTKSSGRASEG